MKKAKTLMDIIQQEKIYEGKFWNRHIQAFQEWDEQQEWYTRFRQFCTRMYLD